jgi:predicted transposase YbfD/YdcC
MVVKAVASQKPLPSFSIAQYFQTLKDPRRVHGRRHLLHDIVVIALCATIAGAQDWQEIEVFARNRIAWLRTFLRLPNGVPSHDTFERVFALLEPQAFQNCFRDWVQSLQEKLAIKHVAIDGKTLRGSALGPLGPLHLVSAWAVEQRLSLGQVAVAEKSNEITAIPALLDLLDIRGAFVSIDAMGCQKAIAAKIIDGGGHYILTAKDNQPTLVADIQQAFLDLDNDQQVSVFETSERGHGREEFRSYLVLHDVSGISQAAEWRGLTTIGICYSRRTIANVTTEEARYFIGSKKVSARTYAKGLRGHWGIENNLHWQLDVTFAEDRNRASNRHGAENLALLRRAALALLQAHPAKLSIAKKRYAAALTPDFLEEICRGDGILDKA